jgi:hypothetical protein
VAMNSIAILDLAVNNGPVGEFTPAALRELVDRGLVPEVQANNVIIYGEHTGDRGVWNFTGARLVETDTFARAIRALRSIELRHIGPPRWSKNLTPDKEFLSNSAN